MKFKSDVDVEAALAVSGGVTVTDSATGVNIDSSGHASLRLDRGSTSYDNNIMFSTAGDTKFRIWQDGDADYLYIRDDDNGTNMVTFKKGGNVGIGTTGPTSPLTIKSNSLSSSLSGLTIQSNGNTNNIFELGEKSTDGARLQMYDAGVAKIALYTDGTDNYINAGNVGIGLTDPDSKLDINAGVANNIPGPAVRISKGASPIGLIRYDTVVIEANDVATIRIGESDGTVSSIMSGDNNLRINSTDPIKFYTEGTTTGEAHSGQGGTFAMIINNSQNVGIGTTAPGAKLEVVASVAGFATKITNNQDSSQGLLVRTSDNDPDEYILDLQSSTSATGTDYTTKFNVTKSGNVGIGTTAPNRDLHVIGQIALDNAATNPSAGMLITADGTSNKIYSRTANNNSTPLAFEILSGASSSLYITSGGSVGMGTTAPNEELEVRGSSFTSIAVTSDRNTINENIGSFAFYGRNDNATPETLLYSRIMAGMPSVTDGAESGNIFFQQINAGTIQETFGVTSTGSVRFNQYGAGTLVTDASGNITVSSGGGAGGPYLPLAGGTMSGNVNYNDNIRARFGTGEDFQVYHDGTDSYINNGNDGGHLYIQNDAVDKDIVFKSDDGAGGTTTYFYLDGSGALTRVSKNFRTDDNVKLQLGAAGDASLYHNGTNTVFINDTGHLIFENRSDDKDIYFNSDDGSGGVTTYFYLDGGLKKTLFWQSTRHIDNVYATFGTSDDLQIYHDGSDSYIKDAGAGDLRIVASATKIYDADSSHFQAIFTDGGSVDLYYSGNKKFETTSTGVTVTGAATATTFLGDLNGTINTVTTAVTKANATNDTTVATTAFVQNLIGTIPAGLVFQGTWNAATNTPTLTSGSGTTGHFYIVSTSGSTNLDGVTDWVTGDWAVFIEQGGTDAWEKIDNSSVLDGAGTGQTVALWSGSGTSNTLTDAPITVSGNNTTFTGTGAVIATGLFRGDTLNNQANTHNIIYRSGTSTFIAGGDKLVVQDGGNVGIGTASPDSLLHLSSSFPEIRLQDNAYTATNHYSIIEGNGGSGVLTLSADDSNAAANSAMVFKVDASERMRITSGGNVGIGTNSPSSNLEVIDPVSGNFSGEIKVGGNGSSRRLLLKQDTVLEYLIGASGSGSLLKFGTGNGAAERMRITDTGNVGIGTTSPGAKLAITQTTAAEGLRIDGASGGFALIVNGGTSYKTSLRNASVGNGYGGNTPPANGLIVEGDVGIGTTAPGQKLHVVGNTFLSSGSAYMASYNNTNSYHGSLVWAGLQLGNNGVNRIVAGRTGVGGSFQFWTNNTNNAADYQVTPDGTMAMSILNNGNVGIGTTAPLANLDIANTNGGIYQQWSYDNPGANNYNLQLTETVTSGNVRWVFDQKNAGTVYSDLLVFNQGLIGMGTDEPDGQLNIFKTFSGITSALTLTNNQYGSADNTGSSIRFQGYAAFKPGSSNPRYSEIIGVNGGNSSPKRIDFKFTNDATITTPLSVLQGGNVGIGTTDPTSKLTVAGQIMIAPSSGTASIKFQDSGSTNAYIDLTDSQQRFDFRDDSDTVMSVTLDTLRVGIGTTSPSSKLQVAGGIQMADDTATAAAAKVGTMRYRTGTEYVEVTGVNENSGSPQTFTQYGSNTVAYSGNDTIITYVDSTSGAYQYLRASYNTPGDLTVGQTYRINITFKVNQGSITWQLHNGSYITAAASSNTDFETLTIDFVASETVNNFIRPASMGTGEIVTVRNIELFEVTSEDASYADMCMQTGASTYEWVNIVRNTY